MTIAVSWHKRTMKRLVILGLLAAVTVYFVMSPFYARGILWALNKIPVSVNQVAAASQKGDGRIEETEEPEPGSAEWLERQQQTAEQQAQLLLQQFEQQERAATAKNNPVTGANSSASNQTATNQSATSQPVTNLAETLVRLQDYSADETKKSTAKKNKAQQNKAQQHQTLNSAHVIVVLGGGLGRDANRQIIVNAYTRMRLEKAVLQKQHNPLPILLSGVEAPYMQRWLQAHQVEARLLEDRSMNTCENTRFSSLLLQKKGGAPRVELITDAYHMPRARRLFAINGIDTIPVVAPLPHAATQWQPSRQNLMHSRRATYEAIATMRDLWFGETNCREVP